MRLVLITGITGKLGEEYLEYFSNQENTLSVGVSRREPIKKSKKVVYLLADLLNKKEIKKEIKKLDFSKVDRVLFIHPIGMFKFEYKKPIKDNNKDGIDDEVYSSNVLTFTNIFNILKTKIKEQALNRRKIKLDVCAFGSITDKYNIPYWNSYTKSKNKLRKIVKKSIALNKAIKIRGIFVNISTADTGNERNLRPYADRTYWLSTKEIVDISMEVLSDLKRSWTEVNLFKNNPNFNPTWYTNHDNVLERWMTQMGGSNGKN